MKSFVCNYIWLKLKHFNLQLAKRKTAKELGIRKTLIPPDAEAMEDIKSHFVHLQRTYSPYFKLKELLAAVTKIYQSSELSSLICYYLLFMYGIKCYFNKIVI